MVKRDYFPAVLTGLSKLAALLCLALWLYVVWQVVAGGLSQLTLEAIFVLVVGPFAMRYFFKGAEWQQWKRVERLRRNPKEAALYPLQPRAGEAHVSLSLILSASLAPMVYFGFVLFWLALLGLGLLFFKATLDMAGTLAFVLLWVLLGGVIMGLTGILMYQRIEVTQQGFGVQVGLSKHSIPWEEAQLFAALGMLHSKNVPTRYELSSVRAFLHWQINYPGMWFRTTPRQKQEYEMLLNEIHASIGTQTGLPLLDLH